MNNEAINEMAAAIVSSRDFCGDERSAAREACFDVAGRAPTADEYRAAMVALMQHGWATR